MCFKIKMYYGKKYLNWSFVKNISFFFRVDGSCLVLEVWVEKVFFFIFLLHVFMTQCHRKDFPWKIKNIHDFLQTHVWAKGRGYTKYMKFLYPTINSTILLNPAIRNFLIKGNFRKFAFLEKFITKNLFP